MPQSASPTYRPNLAIASPLARFAMDREGHVLAHRLERGSGADLLDEEVLAMIERAQQLPAVPPEVAGDRLEFVVPIQFVLR
jgi:protein TonB